MRGLLLQLSALSFLFVGFDTQEITWEYILWPDAVKENSSVVVPGFVKHNCSTVFLVAPDTNIHDMVLNGSVSSGGPFCSTRGNNADALQFAPKRILRALTWCVNTGCHKLQRLIISNYGIKKIDDYTFEGFNSLYVLRINYNSITNIRRNAFVGLNFLRVLSLKGNGIEDIDENAFRNMKNLSRLNLRGNNLTIVNWNWFVFSDFLVSIDLSENKIGGFTGFHVIVDDASRINSESFIETLEVSDNLLKSLDKRVLERVPFLQYLGASNNEIESIENDTFSGLRCLRFLDLSFNHLKTPNSEWLGGLRHRGFLVLHDNPFNCNCNIVDFFTEIESRKFELLGRNMECAGPNELRGRPINRTLVKIIDRVYFCSNNSIPTQSVEKVEQPESTKNDNHELTRLEVVLCIWTVVNIVILCIFCVIVKRDVSRNRTPETRMQNTTHPTTVHRTDRDYIATTSDIRSRLNRHNFAGEGGSPGTPKMPEQLSQPSSLSSLSLRTVSVRDYAFSSASGNAASRDSGAEDSFDTDSNNSYALGSA